MYLVAVTFRIRPAHADDFLTRVQQQAADSLTESGCQRFDVWQSPTDPATVFLYEIYDDRAAFDVHLDSEHFKAFDAEVSSWIADKAVETAVLSAG